MPDRSSLLRRILGATLLAGVLVAVMVAPVAVGVGELANQITDSAQRVSNSVANAQLTIDQMPLVTTVTDRNGDPMAYLYDQYRLPARFDQISDAMKAAIISIEDRRFYQDKGIDPLATLRAALHNSSGGSLQGASTITQQYVKNYLINVVDRGDPANQQADQADNLARKLREAEIAVRLDRNTPKNDVLTGYLDLVEFSGNIYGVGAAAAAYFHTTPDKLTVAQAALLAGMVNNPNLYNPYTHPDQALRRRNVVIDAMVSAGSLTPAQAAPAKAEPLAVVPDGPTIPGSTCLSAAPDAGFFCDYVVSYLRQQGFTADQLDTGGYTVHTTMDPIAASAIKAAVEHNVPADEDGVANTFALVKPQDGGHEVLAMVANRNLGTDAAHGEVSTNIVANASNVFGAGSSFKIFTTAAALERGVVGYDTDLPNPYAACFTPPVTNRYTHCYPVQNDGTSYPNPISLQNALATSPNVAFVNIERQTGMQAVLDMAHRLGLRHTLTTNVAGGDPITDPGDPLSRDPRYSEPQSRYFHNLLSFTLGVSPVSTLEMANVAATLVDRGRWCPPSPVLSMTDRHGRPVALRQQPCEQVVDPGLADTLRAGLSQDTRIGTSAAAARNAKWTRPDLGKTGTTNSSESVAFVGAVDGYAASSMLFADGRRPRELCPGPPVHLGDCGHGAFGGTVAAPPYFQAMNQILAGQPDQPVPPPDPRYLQAGPHGKVVPYTVGEPSNSATADLDHAGYPARPAPQPSGAPRGQVVGQSPQGNVPAGTPITLYTSTGIAPSPLQP
jgi:membrane peptidoglycan carboxypeptidase